MSDEPNYEALQKAAIEPEVGSGRKPELEIDTGPARKHSDVEAVKISPRRCGVSLCPVSRGRTNLTGPMRSAPNGAHGEMSMDREKELSARPLGAFMEQLDMRC